MYVESTCTIASPPPPHQDLFCSNMGSPKLSSGNIDRRGVALALTLAGIFGSSAAHSVVAAVATKNPPAGDHKDLVDRYLQAISEQDGPGGAATPSEENGSCFAGWDASCQDNKSFLSAMGASCKMHEGFDCTMLHAIGYSEKEVYDVVNNCPCSCNVPCGVWTFTPSAAPSALPSSTPSASPSASPTSRPSDVPSSSPTSSPSSSPTVSAAPTISPKPSPPPTAVPTQSESVEFRHGGRVGGILAAFAGVSGVAALVYCAKQGRLSKHWGASMNSFGSKDDALSAEEYNNGFQLSRTKKSGLVDLEHGNDIEDCPSAIDRLYSDSNESAGSCQIPMVVEDRVEIVELPAIQPSNSLGSGENSMHLSKSISKSFAEGDLEMITEVNVGDSNGVDKDSSTGHDESDLEKTTEVSVGKNSIEVLADLAWSEAYDADFGSVYSQHRAKQSKKYPRRQDSSTGHDESDLGSVATNASSSMEVLADLALIEGYRADTDSVFRKQGAGQPKKYRRRRANSKTPPRPGGNRAPGTSSDSVVTSASRGARPPLYVSPKMQGSESIGRMTMLSTPQSVDSESSCEQLVLPHEGSI